MRISINWLRELVKVAQSPQELAELLTIAGIEVEEIEDRREWAKGVVIGKIIDRQPHPNADKLSVCQVDIGQENPSTIVCGAPNARADILVPVATLGTHLAKINLTIKPAKLRGVKSEGMICSLAELGLTKDSEGIHIFSQENLPLGTDVRPLLGLDEVILDISPTANRADALSMIGVAREVAALTGGELSLPKVKLQEFSPKKDLTLEISENKACPAYIGTVIEGVKIGPSPLWLQQRLQAAGLRSINNVVDITNYVLLEWGQPLHAFDRDRLQSFAGGKSVTIGVRFAEEGEKIISLDGQERSLKELNLLITANNKPVALAGVMGGQDTEVNEETVNLVLESALFDPIAIRRSSKAQGLRSESSGRYERGVNPAALEYACQRAIDLILELAGGTVSSQVKADYRADQSSRSIELRLERLQQLLGQVTLDNGAIGEILAEDVERILGNLGCELQLTSKNPVLWTVTVPDYRYRDLEREIDLIEEVARLYGYDRFVDTLPAKTAAGGLSFEETIQRRLREAFRAVGLTELVQYSLVKPELAEVVLANPLFVEYSALRTNLLDGLIEAFEYNQSQGNGALNGFEIGRVFRLESDNIKEYDAIAGIFGGDFFPAGRWLRSGKEVAMTWYEAKGILEAVFDRLSLTVSYEKYAEDARFHPGRTASLGIGKQPLGIFGQLHPQLRQQKGLIEAVYAFEIQFPILLATLSDSAKITPRLQVYSTYPGAARDIAFFVSTDIPVDRLTKTIKNAGGNLLEKVELFDRYQGQNVPENHCSLAFSLVYRASDRTLTDEDVEPLMTKVREALVKQFQVSLRS
ncbi:phenylalanine--tRNA ligase subunit beta [Microcystis flos-aquae FACHB-1344]|uniref:Phenylalanine--tRNA ligase beta subunit n=1 Tax=Microcystis flos-aquae FACHB-1344 TaxID=2692899 RepID=A0ABR8HZ82_9CHRO|nr:phenylalanine--tRNA ligase subunit beta [Microcystis flos-aquae]MBD2624095.1 phenylalanine--tRNA ligase subunit beta [Microcystis flos-aquae FACHB-1344]